MPPAQSCVQLPVSCARAGSCWAGAREHLSSDRGCCASSASRGCSFPCPPRAVVPPAACVHKDDLSLCEQQSSQLSQECDPGCCAAGNSHSLGPCQPAAASPKPGNLGGQCSWGASAQCLPGCDTHQSERLPEPRPRYRLYIPPVWELLGGRQPKHSACLWVDKLLHMEIWGKAGLGI